MLVAVAEALTGIRGAKSQAKVSMRTELTGAEITGPAEALTLVQRATDDLRAAGRITGDLVFSPTDRPRSTEGHGHLTVTADIAAP